MLVSSKFQTVVQSERVEWHVDALQLFYNGIGNQRGGLALYFLQQCVSGLTVNQRYDGLLLVCADNGVPLPVARAQSEFDQVGPFFNANTSGYVPTTISRRPIALAPLLLAAQPLVELAACGTAGMGRYSSERDSVAASAPAFVEMADSCYGDKLCPHKYVDRWFRGLFGAIARVSASRRPAAGSSPPGCLLWPQPKFVAALAGHCTPAASARVPSGPLAWRGSPTGLDCASARGLPCFCLVQFQRRWRLGRGPGLPAR